MSLAFYGKGFFAFMFENKEYQDLIFRNGHTSWEQEECI
jgi:hypothetical protein